MKGFFIKLLIRIFVIELNIYLKWSLFCQKYLMKERLELPKIKSLEEIENLLGEGIWKADPWWLAFDAISSPEYSYYNLVNKKQPYDCLDVATRIIIKDKQTEEYGYKTLSDLKNTFQSYQALSYNFSKNIYEFQDILSWIDKGKREVYLSRTANGHILSATPKHRFFTINRKSNNIEEIEYQLCVDQITNREKYKTSSLLTAKKIPYLNQSQISLEDYMEAWLIGIYVAEGYSYQDRNSVYISNDSVEIQEKIMGYLKHLNIPYSPPNRKKHAYITVKNSWLSQYLKLLGSCSFDIHFPTEIFKKPQKYIEAILDGYTAGDAWKKKANKIYKSHKHHMLCHNTSSDKLAYQLMLIYLILGKPLSVNYCFHHQGAGKYPIWRLYQASGEGVGFREKKPGVLCRSLKQIDGENITTREVADLTIANNHNFVLLNGLIAHNCDDTARLSCELLTQLPQYTEIQMLSVQWLNPEGKFVGHNVCIFKNGETYSWMGNWYHGQAQHGFDSPAEIAKTIVGSGTLLSWFTFQADLQHGISQWHIA